MADAILGTFLHIVSRQTAISVGLNHYFTGKPCKRGHLSLRSTSRKACRECEQQYRDERKAVISEYKRQYHQKHKEKLCKVSRDWYSANKQKAAEYNRAYYLKNKERYTEWRAAWASDNPEKKRSWEQQWRKENCVRLAAASREWKRKNPERVLAHNRNRRALARGADGSHTAQGVHTIYSLQRGRCAHCSRKVGSEYHVDHIVPLVRGGSNWPENLQILCPKCNMSKNRKDPFEWKQQNGMLL